MQLNDDDDDGCMMDICSDDGCINKIRSEIICLLSKRKRTTQLNRNI